MRTLPLLTALLAVAACSAPAGAQPQAAADETRVVHPGARHDEQAHKAALRARKEGRRLVEPRVHPGGRHDELSHRAALRAQRAADEAAKKASDNDDQRR